MRIFKKMHQVPRPSKKKSYYQLLKFSKVFNSESPNEQNIEKLTLTDILEINYVLLLSCNAEKVFSK
jgi:hypothetical protein